MRIITAAAAGMCFGVRDALRTITALEDPESVSIYGELVHNPIVLSRLRDMGFQALSETERAEMPATERVVITAHGISDRQRQKLIDAGKRLIDTTCPLVTRVHDAAKALVSKGTFVVVIGRANHVEVQGIVGDLDRYIVVESLEQVETYPAASIGIVSQTTFPVEEASTIAQRIIDRNPHATIQWPDTICQPTKDRQRALRELLDQVQAVVVVGGRRSHNTQRLIDVCRSRDLMTFHVESSEELEPRWFSGFQTIGLTAGTSTLPETLQSVHDRLVEIGHEFYPSPNPQEGPPDHANATDHARVEDLL